MTETKRIQIRRGLKEDLPDLHEGEPALTTDTKEIYVGTATSENIKIAKADDLGDVTLLETTDKSSAVKAINELKVKTDDLGTVALKTTAQKVKEAINENYDQIGILEKFAVNVEKFPIQVPEANDTTRIQRAIDSIPNGGTIFLPDNTYMIDPSISVKPKAKQTLLLAPNAILKAVTNALDDYNIVWIDRVENVSIIGGTIEGDRDTHTGTTGEKGHGIRITAGKNIRISDVTIKKTWGDGIYMGGASPTMCEDVFIDNCVIDNARRNGLSITGVKRCIVSHTVFKNIVGTNPNSGVDIEPNVSETATDIDFIGCIFEGCGKNGFQVYDQLGNLVKRVNVIGCISINNTQDGFRFANANNFTLSDCQVIDNGRHGVNLDGDLYTIHTFNINGCIIDSSVNGGFVEGHHGINAYKTKDGSIRNNNIKNYVYGIRADYGDYLTIQGNTVNSNTYHGLYLTNMTLSNVKGNKTRLNGRSGIFSDYCNNNVYEGNSIDSNNQKSGESNHNVYFSNSSDNLIASNIVRKGSETQVAATGIYLHSTATNNTLSKNDTKNGGTTELSNNSTTNIVEPFIRSAKGTTAVSSGATTVVITHNLGVTPTNFYDKGNFDMGYTWVTGLSATQYTLNFSKAPTSNMTVYWKVEA